MSHFEALAKRDKQSIFNTYARYPVAAARGKGSRLWDYDGKEYVDLLAGIAVTSLGHANEELAAVMAEQAGKLVQVSNLLYLEEPVVLAERLLATNHCAKVFFCNSGAEANEAAFKLARRYQQRVRNREAYKIISFTGCFHGRTLATVAATASHKFVDGFSPMPEGFVQLPMGDLEAFKDALDGSVAAVILEMVQGEGGVMPLDRDFVRQVDALCREHGVLFIADEIQAGLCRTGKWWAFEHYGIQPDIVTVAKALANGLPMGAMMATEEVARGFEPGTHGTTFGAGAFVSAVAARTIEIMQRDNVAGLAAETGTWAMDRLRRVGEAVPGSIDEVRGMGLLIGVVLSKPGKTVWEKLLERGFICNLTQDRILRLIPALTIPKEDIEAFAQALEAILREE